jgi:integrase/recombinase XerD
MRKKKKSKAPSLNADPGTLRFFIEPFRDWQRIKGYAPETIENGVYMLLRFVEFCEERGVIRPGEASRQVVERYQKYLFHAPTKTGRPRSLRAQLRDLMALRVFFKWLTRERHILYNPASEMELPQIPRALPRAILNGAEMEAVLSQPDIKTKTGQRDRALLELLYSTGMRRMEAARLKVYEVDLHQGTVFIHEGKGRRDRVIPLGERAGLWMDQYLREVRPSFLYAGGPPEAFLNQDGKALDPDYMGHLVKGYVDKAGIGKKGSCHMFRHTCATLMLEGGADVRFVQALLGHSDLSTTEIYTHVSIVKLKEVHARSHPAEVKAKEKTSSP